MPDTSHNDKAPARDGRRADDGAEPVAIADRERNQPTSRNNTRTGGRSTPDTFAVFTQLGGCKYSEPDRNCAYADSTYFAHEPKLPPTPGVPARKVSTYSQARARPGESVHLATRPRGFVRVGFPSIPPTAGTAPVHRAFPAARSPPRGSALLGRQTAAGTRRVPRRGHHR